ncbi:MAG: hypothetical protein NC201_04770 [Prevotella sp.]|nr:hypothetical protein [Bacteroides sp.]MCM1366543.1 hypothetical protein [Prevotella sp.]MCM1436853.1 hypothetical protein [Prevotella sp.]
MKKIALSLLAGLALMSASPAGAVTNEEMEQARTIAATRYLRYANNMSAYLDDISPKTMQELQGQLKDKEKENLKAFLAVSTPTDYASWDKEKLVAYWGGEFFKNNSGLDKKGADCYNDVKKRLGSLKVSAPGTAQPAAKTSSADAAKTTLTDGMNSDGSVSLTDDATPDAGMEETAAADNNEEKGSSNTWTYVIILGILVIVVIWLVVYASNVMKRNNNSRRNTTERRKPRDPEDYPSAAPGKPTPSARVVAPRENRETIGDSRVNDNRTRRLERELTERDAEIRRLEADLKMAKGDLRHSQAELEETNRLLEESRRENGRLRSEIINLTEGISKRVDGVSTAERPARQSFHKSRFAPDEAAVLPINEEARKETEEKEIRAEERRQAEIYGPKPVRNETVAEVIAPVPSVKAETPSAAPAKQKAEERKEERRPDASGHIFMPRTSAPAAQRTIFLGRVNTKGMFVRADRNFNPGNSYYRLITSDGLTGSFSVINDPSVWELALVQPDEVLFNACSGPQLNETYGRNEIITQTPGKAVFEDGAWKVVKKAEIRYL